MPTVILPGKNPGEGPVTISRARSLVVVGANGTGKTRLGAFVEQQAGARGHRISAQRSLMVPSFVQPRAYQQAEKTLYCGTYQPQWSEETHFQQKIGQRWASEPYTAMLNDYEHLLAFLFADEAKRNRDYARSATKAVPTATAPKCKIDALSDIWSTVMPQRELAISDDRLNASVPGGTPYEGRHMSDGERVAIYLMGQALCAPPDAVVIIDEPEIHLHRAIQAVLWDQIEGARQDCTFVYITHDLEFAATRVGSRRIWLKGFDGTSWTWDEVGAASVLPDALEMQVLGTRRPIVFVEGDETSHDASVYAALYPKEHVVPRQSCEKVVEATKAMAQLPAFHHLKVRGIVDRDRRGDAEVAALKVASVSVVDVAEVENLLCIPEAIVAVAERLERDPPTVLAAARDAVLEQFRMQLEHQALSRALAEVQFRLSGFGPKIAKSDAKQLGDELDAYVKSVDVGATVAAARALLEKVAEQKDYLGALRFFNCKGNVSFVARAIGLERDVYVAMVIGILKKEPSGAVATAMRKLVKE